MFEGVCQLLLIRLDEFDGLIGAIVGGLIGLISGFGLEYWRLRREEKKTERKIKTAIALEIKAIWGFFMSSQGEEWRKNFDPKKPGRSYPFIHRAEESYFVVFDSLAGEVALLGDEKLAALIFGFYTKAKGLLDFIRLNGDLLNEASEHGASGDTLERAGDFIHKTMLDLEDKISNLKINLSI